MKRILLAYALFSLLACQNRNTREGSSAAGNPEEEAKFEIHKEFHNFGTLQDGEIVSYSFWFKNSGEAPLLVTGTDTDCGCIQVSVPEKMTMPGDSAYVEVVYNSAGDVGKVLKTVTVFGNTEKKKVQFHIVANVKNKWIEFNN
jgi:hypothetical protein